MGSIAPATGFAMCTIAETPRIPEHCIAYAYISLWEKEFGDKKVDKDSATDMQWIYEKALDRSRAYGIDGVTYFKTLGVVKNIIPAVASTNCTIAAACCNEALKIITSGSQSLNCNYMIMGNEGFYTSTFEYVYMCMSVCLSICLYVSLSLSLSLSLPYTRAPTYPSPLSIVLQVPAPA